MDSLKLSVLTPHHATTGCKCRECFGLAEFMLHATGNTHGLTRIQAPQVAHAVTLSPVDVCTGALTCECGECSAERLRLMEQPRRRVKQPWEIQAA